MTDPRADDIISLRHYIETLIKAADDKAALHWDAHGVVHAQIDEARKLVIAEFNRRLLEMNEFRKQVNDERDNFVSKDVYQPKHDDVINRMERFENWRSNLEGKMWMLGAVITGLTVIINLVIKLLFK